ncbi:DUF3899 domain-containing protein [Guptibacillus algicola]|uniref:DUF3899 domain-containing protein n=1 Tax=Guptibacillus algicola TaxID=225844 RepID=UPI001CD582B7|nr:DUF3899 domain-containing protein [Alkalihalobacillus algicola]MCA0987807.1 DUF3899 domain-containing protein [Alkalihalobacillus algicola]
MKSLLIRSGVLIVLSFVAAIITSILSDKGYSLQGASDILFMIALAMLLIGAALHVVQTGFFDGIVYSFKRFIKSSTKHQMIEEDKSELSYKLEYNNPVTYPILIAGGFWTIITILIAVAITNS